jgi:hypothetical protein
MTQNHNFGFKPRSRREAVAQHADEKRAIAIINHNYVMIRQPPRIRRMGFSEATGIGSTTGDEPSRHYANVARLTAAPTARSRGSLIHKTR